MQKSDAAIGYGYNDARFTHNSNRVTFETLAVSFALGNDPQMQRIAATVH